MHDRLPIKMCAAARSIGSTVFGKGRAWDGGGNITVIIGDRLRVFREEKHLSQGDIEKRTGLLRCYISRVENGHTVPSIETLEKLARALEVPLYQLFYEGEEPPSLPVLPKGRAATDIEWGSRGKDARMFVKLRRLLSVMDAHDRRLLLFMAQKIAGLKGRGTRAAARS